MDNLNKQFGILIAYLLPGFVALTGVAPLVPPVAGWLRAGESANLGAPVYAVLAAIAAGMVVSCFRWLLIDQLHSLMGLGAPAFNSRALQERPAAFNYLVENHYRYYQFYSNTVVAVAWTYSIHRWLGSYAHLGVATDAGALILCTVLFAGSRDALSKYRNRSKRLIRETTTPYWNGELMTNGIDHNHGTSDSNPQQKPEAKPPQSAKPQSGERKAPSGKK